MAPARFICQLCLALFIAEQTLSVNPARTGLRGLNSEGGNTSSISEVPTTGNVSLNTSETIAPSQMPPISASSGPNSSFMLFATIIIGFIVVAYGLCMIQMVRICCCKLFRTAQDTTELAAPDTTVLYHEGMVLNLTERQRRAVLEAIFSETSKNVTEKDLSPKRRKRRGKSKDFNPDEEEGIRDGGDIPTNVEIPACSTAGTVLSEETEEPNSETMDQSIGELSDDNNDLDDKEDCHKEKDHIDSQEKDIDNTRDNHSTDKIASQESAEKGERGSGHSPRARTSISTPRRQRKQLHLGIADDDGLTDEEDIYIYEDDSEAEDAMKDKEPAKKENSKDNKLAEKDEDELASKTAYEDVTELLTNKDALAETPASAEDIVPSAHAAVARIPTKTNQGTLPKETNQRYGAPHNLFPYRHMMSMESEDNNEETGSVSEDTIVPEPPEAEDESDEQTVKAGGERLSSNESCSSADSVDSAILAKPIDLTRFESFTTCSASEYDDDTEENVCAICLSGYTPGDTLIVSKHCSHLFHKECILEWLEKRDECPICRVDMVTQEQMSKAATSIVGRAEMVRAAAAMNGSTTPTRIPPRNLHGTNGGNGSGIGGPNWRTPPVGTMNPGFR